FLAGHWSSAESCRIACAKRRGSQCSHAQPVLVKRLGPRLLGPASRSVAEEALLLKAGQHTDSGQSFGFAEER
ncbi:hypothetical protein E4U54_006969, partial [Claviceps lovelessii]